MACGYLYILQNKSFGPFVVKIGFTTLTPDARAKQIFSGATGVPEPFDIAYACHVEDCQRAENLIHQRLATYRIHQRREFFQMSPKVAQQIVYSVCREVNGELGANHEPIVFIHDTISEERNWNASDDSHWEEPLGNVLEIDPAMLNQSPIGTSTLTKEQKERIGIVKAILEEFYPGTKEEWHASFTRDTNPEHELRIWEHIAKAFLKIDQITYFSDEQRKEVYVLLLLRSGSSTKHILRTYGGTIFAEATMKAILNTYELPPIPVRVRYEPSKKKPNKITIYPKILDSTISQIYGNLK